MGDFIYTQNSFAAGEISPEFFARENIDGLSKLENMDVLPSGALTRRKGLALVAELADTARLIAFSVRENENYLLALTENRVNIFNNGKKIANLFSPWTKDDLKKLQYAQRFGTMIFVHPDFQPQILKKKDDGFEMAAFGFSSNTDMTVNMPFMKFDDAVGIEISVSNSGVGNNYATFTTDKDFWTSDYLHSRLLLLDKQWTVMEYISPRVVIASTNGGYLLPTSPVSDWSEAAFGARRGWPCSITFHQDRLVFGGSREWPSGVWMSKVGEHNNFDVGTGLDDEAIFITLLSEQRQQICTVVSSDNLQILTSVGEWAISNKPLTPSAVNIKQHTSIGSISVRHLPPQKIEEGTVFVSNSGNEIRELSLDELGETYNANDLCAMSKHIMRNPVDLAFNCYTNQLFVVMDDGDIAVLNKRANLGICAWGIYKTQGSFESVAVIDGETFVTVKRENQMYIEKFSTESKIDGDKFGFSYTAAGLPLMSGKHAPKKIKIRKITARLLETKSININSMRVKLPNSIYEPNAGGYSGDVSINLLGTNDNVIDPQWIISGSDPQPATVLSVTVSGRYSI